MSNKSSADMTKELSVLAHRIFLDNLDEAIFFPKYFQIETVHFCNAKCKYCTVHQWDSSRKFMDNTLFYKIADEIIENRDWVESVCLARAGEPLLDKKLVERVRYLKSNGIKHLDISTNVALLDSKKSIDLLEAGLDDIMLSIDSLNEETYYKIKKGINFNAVMKNAITYIELRNKINPKSIIRVRAVLQPENENEKHEWETFWSNLLSKNDRIYFKYEHSWGNQLENYNYTDIDEDTINPCVVLWSSFNITANGKVGMCNADYEAKMDLGDVNLSTIKDIWQSEKFNSLRATHAAGNRNTLNFCRGCKIWDLDHRLENKA